MKGIIQIKTFSFLLRLVLLFQVLLHHYRFKVSAVDIGSNFPHEKHNNEGDWDLKVRMEQMEHRSQRQENEIIHLKTKAGEDRNAISRLENRVAQLEAASTLTNPLVRSKRPYRLIPPPFVRYNIIILDILVIF